MALWNVALALPGLIAPRAGIRALYGVGTRDFHTWFQHWMMSGILLALGAMTLRAAEPAKTMTTETNKTELATLGGGCFVSVKERYPRPSRLTW